MDYADIYNRQLHPDERKWAKDHAKDFAAVYEKATGRSITQDQAENKLLANGYIRVDSAAASGGTGYDATAAQYLTQNAGGLFTKDQYYNNPFLFGNGGWVTDAGTTGNARRGAPSGSRDGDRWGDHRRFSAGT